jgi:hypothetical protein
MKGRYLLVAVGILCAGLMGVPALATHDGSDPDPRVECTCETTPEEACTQGGHLVSLLDFHIDQFEGSSVWTYEVCNMLGVPESPCPVVVDPLGWIDMALPKIGECLTAEQQVDLVQVGGFDQAQLDCSMVIDDPLCGIRPQDVVPTDRIPQCRVVSPSNLDPGECVQMELQIAGEMPTLGAGFDLAFVNETESPDCARECIVGPSCHPCTPPPDGECLTRTIGFWGNHPHITQLYKPVTVCGITLDSIAAGQCDSLSEALCTSGKDNKNKQYLSLVSQLTAAKLNLNATAAGGGACGTEIGARIAECELLCGAGGRVISNSGCVEDLAAFNESQDTVGSTEPPFDRPGPAQNTECKAARGNGIAIGKKGCAP